MGVFYILTGTKLWAGKENNYVKAQRVLGAGEQDRLERLHPDRIPQRNSLVSEHSKCKEAIPYHQQPIWKFPHKPTSGPYVFPAY